MAYLTAAASVVYLRLGRGSGINSTMPTKAKNSAGRGPLSGRFTRNGWLSTAGFAVLAGLGAAFVLAAVIRWGSIQADLITVMTGRQAAGTVLDMTNAAPGAQDSAYVATVEFTAGDAGVRRISRALQAPTGTGPGGDIRLRMDRPVTVSYRPAEPDRAVLWTMHEPWTAIWTVPVGLALIALAWALRPRD
jgi:hypothetical protein